MAIVLVVAIDILIAIIVHAFVYQEANNYSEKNENQSFYRILVEIFIAPVVYLWRDFFKPEIVTTLATVAIAIYTYILAVATKALTTLASNQEQTSKIHERAYGFGGPGPIRRQRPEGVLIRIEFGNHGRTPAFLREVEWSVLPEKSLPQIPVYQKRLANRMTVSPGTRENTEASYICEFDWVDRHALCVRFTYEDVFGVTHQSGTLVRIKIAPKQTGLDAVVSHPPIDGYPEYVKWD